MKRYICIHGHFYQPPRENPWLEVVELQDSAWPYHDWNERVTAECYAPNAASRILDESGRVVDIVNNYSRISFNFGPTLLAWLEKNAADVYGAILEADRLSQQRFSGHGSGLAQVYSHMIMPLANSRDKRTQVVWGIRDFERRFKRKPEGMWLAESAVDLETLEVLAQEGIKFTLLAPGQARRVRKIGGRNWRDVSGQRVDPKMPYLCRLPSGKSIDIFFYDGPISNDIAFGKLLVRGEHLADRLMGAFVEKQGGPQLVNIATDGETYGHHHRFGDMALAYCLHHIEANDLARITVYGEYLEQQPPTHEVEIHENSSWSCVHGVARWKEACGCCSGSNPGWHQDWRAPLRQAMDWLRDKLIELYEKEAPQYLKDPWRARDDYIDVILDRSPSSVDHFLQAHAARELDAEAKVKARKLLEMQMYAMLMFTSCGWFFDEVSGIETVQIILYAARALQLARETAGWDLEPEYLSLLESVPSNIPEFATAAGVYERLIKPEMLDLLRVGAHYAIASLFAGSPDKVDLFCYSAQSEIYDRLESGRQKLAVGRARLRSNITGEYGAVSFAVVHFGDQNIMGGVREYAGDGEFEELRRTISAAFSGNKMPDVISHIDRFFGQHSYSLWHLFKDEQRRILNQIAEPSIAEVESSLWRSFKDHQPLMEAMNKLRIPLPRAFYATAKFVFNRELRKLLLEEEETDLGKLRLLVSGVQLWPIKLDKKTLGYAATQRINKLMERLNTAPADRGLLQKIDTLLEIFNQAPLELPLDLWKAQNIYFSLYKDNKVKDLDLFKRIGGQLKVKVG